MFEHSLRDLEAKGPALKEWPAVQPVIDLVMGKLDICLQQRGERLPPNLYAGVYPTGRYNATIYETPNGTLVLLNLGLMLLMHKICKLFMYFVHERSGFDRELVDLIRRIFTAQLPEGKGDLPSVPPLGGALGVRSGALLLSAETFVLAHELGHYVLGHIDDTRTLEDTLGIEHPAVLVLRRSKELEADKFSVECMLAGGVPDLAVPEVGSDSTGYSDLFIGGPWLFLRLYEVLKMVGEAWGVVDPARDEHHPPALERLTATQVQFANAGMPGAGVLLLAMDLWLVEVTKILMAEGPLATSAETAYRW